jgi:hypothetical protein
MIPQARVDKLKKDLEGKARAVQRVLLTEDGQVMMKALRDEFMFTLAKESPHGPAYRVGTADVLAYLMQLNDFQFTTTEE